MCVCVGKGWTLPAVSNEVRSLIRTASAASQPGSLVLLQALPQARWEHRLLGRSGLAGFWQKGKPRTSSCSGTGLKTSRYLPPFLCHRSLTKPNSEAAGSSAGLPPPLSPSWGAGGSRPALWPLRAARVGSQQPLGVRLTYPASSSALPWSV